MKLFCSGIENGFFADRFGSKGTQLNRYGICTYSVPFHIEAAPETTVSYAVFLEDKDAFPVSGGFSWIHWTACNIKHPFLKENASADNPDFIQGVNSYISIQGGGLPRPDCIGYAGMSPPDSAHIYELSVYALDCMLPLQNGFNMNEMFRYMDGHILAQDTVKGLYGPAL